MFYVFIFFIQMHYAIHRNYILGKQQGKSEVFDSCDRHSNLNEIGFKSSILQPVWPWNLKDDLANTIEHLSNSTLSFVHHFTSIGEIKLELQSGNTSWSQNQRFFVLCDLEIWWMTLKITRTPLLCCFRLCASLHSHRWIQSGFIVRKRSIRDKIDDFSHVTLKFDGWRWKIIGHLYYTTPSFVHNSCNLNGLSASNVF